MWALEVKAPEQRVLVIEDEPDLRELLAYNLQVAGYQVNVAETGQSGLAAVEGFSPHLILLDLMLPDMPGTEVCRRIRLDRARPQPAVVIITAKGEEIDRVVGFEVGADDYVVKPFSVRELLLRVKAILRGRATTVDRRSPLPRQAPRRPRRTLTVGPLVVDVDGHRVFVQDEELHMSSMEMRLLVDLIQHRGRVRSRDDLLEDVWGYKPGVSTRTVDTHVKRLRDKLGVAGALFETVRGTGYRLSDSHAVIETEESES